MQILAAHKYHSPRNGPLTPEQAEIRRISYAIKTIAAPSVDFHTAAAAMASLISGPCWLVPIPNSTGNTDANTKLAAEIARLCPGAQVVKAITRAKPIESQCTRHKAGLGPIAQDAHNFRRTPRLLTLRQTYFVDNVATSGNTLAAAHAALGFGAGLVFADAMTHRKQPTQTTLL